MEKPVNILPSEILDQVLGMIRAFKDDAVRLEKLYRYIKDNLYADTDADAVKIPEKYRSLIREVAEDLECGMTCYINPGTLEVFPVPPHEFPDYEDEVWREGLERIQREWKKILSLEPPESWESFGFMQQFTESVEDSMLRQNLTQALSKRKPFGHFNAIIHQSPAKKDWFAFRQKCMEEYAASNLLGDLENPDETTDNPDHHPSTGPG